MQVQADDTNSYPKTLTGYHQETEGGSRLIHRATPNSFSQRSYGVKSSVKRSIPPAGMTAGSNNAGKSAQAIISVANAPRVAFVTTTASGLLFPFGAPSLRSRV